MKALVKDAMREWLYATSRQALADLSQLLENLNTKQ